jgi:tetratricopeptide (TPR) repeat protein
LNPNYAVGHQFYGAYLTQTGLFAEGIQEARKALELDPLSLALNWSLGNTFYHSREYDHAEEQLRKTIQMDPGYPLAHASLGEVYLQKKMYAQAVSEYKEAVGLRHNASSAQATQAALAVAYARSGDKLKAKRLIEELTRTSAPGAEPRTSIAACYAALDKKDHAIAALEQAYKAREFTLFFLRVDPRFDSLRSDPRFQALLRRIGFPQ